MMWWATGNGWIWMTLTWVIVIGVVVWVLVRMSARGNGEGHGDARDARRILDERFARGDIDEDDYRRRRDALDS